MKLGAFLFAAAGASLALASPLAAQSSTDQPATTEAQAQKQSDMSEVVCEKQEETGSRLSSHRICKTKAQWAEERRADRMDIDKAQTQRGCNQGSGQGSGC